MADPNSWASANTATASAPDSSNAYAQGASNVATVDESQVPTSAYLTALQQANAPQFAQSQQALNANQAANGTLTSGAGNYGQQELAAQNNATIAQGLLPLISSGYQNANANAQQNAAAKNSAGANIYGAQTAANSQNATAGNTLENQLQSEAYGTTTQNATNSLQAQEFNAQQRQQAQLQQLAEQYGLLDTGLGAQNSTIGNGVSEQLSNYNNAAGGVAANNAQQSSNLAQLAPLFAGA